MAMANDHRFDDQGHDAQGESLPPLRNQRQHGPRSYVQQSGSQAPSHHRNPLASDIREQPTRTPESQLVSSLLAVGTAKTPTTRVVEVGDGKGKKCPEFADILKKASPGIVDRKKMKLPASYMGAYEKALVAAGGKPRRLNMLDDADISDSESDFEEPITPGRHGSIRMLTTQTPLVTTIDEPPTPVTIGAQHMCRPVPSTSTQNVFQTLAEDHHELDGETIAALNGLAKVSYRKPDRGTKLAPAP